MKVDLQRGRHWAAGSYIDLMLAAATMQVIFLITIIWIALHSQEFFDQNRDEVMFTLRMQVGLGWMMCIIAGLGFSILPLIYDVTPFDKSLMNVYVAMNMSGQVLLMAGIMVGDVATFHTFSTIGMTLLCTSIVCLGPPALTIFKVKVQKDSPMGPFSYGIGLLLPAIGILILSSWATRAHFPFALDFAEDLVLDLFLPIAIGAILISHFNRRLEWEVISPDHIGKVFGIFTGLLLIEIMGDQLFNYDQITMRLDATLHVLPWAFIFLALRPLKIFKMIKDGEPCNLMVASALLWTPMIGITAYCEAMEYFPGGQYHMVYSRWIMIFGVAMQGLWGFAWYLHEDHKRTSIHTRKQHWFTLLSMNIGTGFILYGMYIGLVGSESPTQIFLIGLSLQGIAYFSILARWAWDVFLGLDDWHMIPMFYDRYLAHPDEGSGFDPE